MQPSFSRNEAVFRAAYTHACRSFNRFASHTGLPLTHALFLFKTVHYNM
jgi:hypothetical protein